MIEYHVIQPANYSINMGQQQRKICHLTLELIIMHVPRSCQVNTPFNAL